MNSLIFVILKKELKDMFRDKKTLIVGLLIPLLLMPILSYFLGNMMKDSNKAVEENCKIAIVDNNNSSITKFLESDKTIKIEKPDKPDDAVKEGDIYLAIKVPDDFDSSLSKDGSVNLKISYDNTSQKSGQALAKINAMIDAYSKEVVAQRLKAKNIDVSILTPVNIVKESFEKEEKAAGIAILSMILPMMLLMYSAQGPLAVATDLGAGEKERGTLEPLLTTKAGREKILTGKLLAITIMGFVISLCSMVGMIVAMIVPNSIFASGSSSVNLSYGSIALITIINLLTTMFFGALELGVSIYARSFKEAQTYLVPFSIIPLFAAYGTMMMDAKNIPSLYFNIPMVNVASVVKELIAGIYDYTHIGLTIGWSVVYVILSLLLARLMFSKEQVIFRS
ncbi:MAG: ABC transporter permease [Clostridiaceae bacterium]